MVEYYKIERELLEATADRCRSYIGNNKGFPPEETPAKIDEVYVAGADMGYDTGLDHGKDAGKKAVWDLIQANGNRVDYGYAFRGWREAKTIEPYYDITTNSLYQIFLDCIELESFPWERIIRTKDDGYINCYQAFQYCYKLTDIDLDIVISPTYSVSASPDGAMNQIFYDCQSLKRVKYFAPLGRNTFTNSFYKCYELEEITFGGTIGNNIDLHWSTKLSRASIESIIRALSSTTSGLVLTLSKTAVDNAFAYHDAEFDYTVPGSQTGEWQNWVNYHPNWTITLID